MKRVVFGLIFGLLLFSLVGYSGVVEKIKDEYNNRAKYVGINIKEIHEESVTNGSGKEIGKRAAVTYNPDKMTDESLSNFYKDKIKDSGYRYYTLINEKDKTQGIESIACINVLTFGKIDNFGSVTKVSRSFEVKIEDQESQD